VVEAVAVFRSARAAAIIPADPAREGAPSMNTVSYCKHFGFDRYQRQRFLSFLQFDAGDAQRIEVLHKQVIDPNVDSIVSGFYGYLLDVPEFSDILHRGFDLDRLEQKQKDYLLALGRDYGSERYFEERLRIGITHARIGLPLSYYEVASHILVELILDRVPDPPGESSIEYPAMVATLLRICSLDVALAIEIYHRSKLDELQEQAESLRATDRALRDRIATDALTRVASYSHTIGVMRRAMATARRTGEPLCVAMIDLDFFKRVNDTHGHLVGDMVLRDTAARMQSALRSFDTIGRYGGEEFLVILEHCPMPEAYEIIERMRHRVGATPIHVDGIHIEMTLSAGIVEMTNGDTVATLIDRADATMYQAKRQGRDRTWVGPVEAGRGSHED
jgi:two-component system cell cycle response regulator